jgi:hypothetical protein
VTRRALMLLLATAAFGAAPLITPHFTGYDPAGFPVLITRPAIQPAGYAFAIWGVIYLWLALHAAFGLWRRPDRPAWDKVRLPLSLSVALGAVWLAIAGASPIWATAVILIMAISALIAFLRADAGVDRWLLSAPLAIYAGWLSAAAAVSLGVVLAGYGWLSDTATAALMLAATLTTTVTIQLRQPKMPVYGLTVIWALVGIIAANWSDNLTVAALAGSGVIIMALTLISKARA